MPERGRRRPREKGDPTMDPHGPVDGGGGIGTYECRYTSHRLFGQGPSATDPFPLPFGSWAAAKWSGGVCTCVRVYELVFGFQLAAELRSGATS